MRALWLALLIGCGSETDSGLDVGAELPAIEEDTGWAPVLDDPSFRFCHEAGVDAKHAREFCPLLEGMPEGRCPGLRETCAGAPEKVDLDRMSSGCAGGEVKPSSTPAPPPEKSKLERPSSCERPQGCEAPKTREGLIGAVLRWGAAFLVAVVVGVFLRFVLLYVRRREAAAVAPSAVVRSAPPPVVDADEVPDLPSGDLLDHARRALDDGRFGDAVLLARGAALRRLGEAGRVRLHRSRTDREYVRSLRKDGAIYAALAELLGLVERVRWGALAPGREQAVAGLAAAERVLRALMVLLVVGLLGAGDDRYRFGPQGDAALYDLYADWGYEVSWRLRGLSSIGDDTNVLVLDLTGITPSDDDWDAVRAWVEGGGILLVGGDATPTFPELGEYQHFPGGIETALVPELASVTVPPVWPDGPVSGFARPGGWTWVEVVDPTSIPAAADGPAVPRFAVVEAAMVGTGWVIGVSDARLLWNGALVRPENESFVGYAPTLGQTFGQWTLPEPTTLQLATLAAAGSQDPFSALANGRLLPFVAQLVLLAGLGALWLGWPFGPLRDPRGEGRLRFADHVAALGRRWARLGASRHAWGTYATFWHSRLGSEGIRASAMRAGRTRDEASRIVRDVEAALRAPPGPNRAYDLRMMEELWSIVRRP